MRNNIFICLLVVSVLSVISGCGPTLAERQKKADAQYQIGVAELNRGNLVEALKYLEDAKTNYPNNPKNHNVLGLIYFQQQRYQDAIRAFQKALQLNPNFAEAHNSLGTIYAELKDWDKAIEEYKAALSDPLYPTPELAHYNLGYVLMERQRREADLIEAVKEFHAAVQIRPKFSQALDKYGIALYRLNRNHEAIKRFKQAIEIAPNFMDPYLNLGIVYMKQGKKREAIQQFKFVRERADDDNLIVEAERYLEMLE